MKMRQMITMALAALALSVSAQAVKAPFVVEGKTYALNGNLAVKGSAKCGRVGGAGGGKSKQALMAVIAFYPDDQFSWFLDSLSPQGVVSSGHILSRNKNGKRLALAFSGEQATALLALANIPSAPNPTGQDVAATHSMKAVVSDKKITITEKAVMKFAMATGGMSCNYKYTISRKMKGLPTDAIFL